MYDWEFYHRSATDSSTACLEKFGSDYISLYLYLSIPLSLYLVIYFTLSISIIPIYFYDYLYLYPPKYTTC